MTEKGQPQQFTDYEITEAMIVFGGDFVSSLGRLFRLADDINWRRLKAAFPGYWTEYQNSDMQARLRERELKT